MSNAVTPQRELCLVDDPASLKTYAARVAFATSDRLHVDQHFGSARLFLVYGSYNDSWHLIKAIEYPEQPMGHDADKLAHRVKALTDCTQLYCNEIGPSAIRRLIQQGIQPLKVASGTCIKTLLKNPISVPTNNVSASNPVSASNKTSEQDNPEKRLLDLLEEDWD
jgi:nitrogen fixation protein NifX